MTSENNKEHAMDWLSDAHGMEESLITIMEKQIKRIENYPDLESKLSEHLEQTRWQADQLRGQLERFDTSPSKAKDAVMKMEGHILGFAHMAFHDEVLKDVLANFAAENYEIICYKSLIYTFKRIKEPEVAAVCENILKQEEDMARWIQDKHTDILDKYMSRENEEAVQKR